MNSSIWAEDLAKARGDYSCLSGNVPASADTVIVGAGYTGLNAARVLAKAGQEVVVFDKDSLGDGASGVNFGSAALGVAADFSSLNSQYGEPFARRVGELSRQVLADLCELMASENIDCDLRRTGHITVAMSPAHLAALEKQKEERDRFGAGDDWVLLSRSALQEYLDIGAACGGLMNRRSYSLNPSRYLVGVYRAACRAGAKIVERTEVLAIERAGTNTFQCNWRNGTIQSRQVVVCTDGIRMPGFTPSQHGIVPVHSYMIATAPLNSEQLKQISPQVFATAHTIACYFRLISGNRLLFGTRKDIGSSPSIPRDKAELSTRMNTLLPFTSGVPVTHFWSGLLGLTFDRLPHIGVWDGVHYALGYCGKGIPWSAHCGIAVANLVQGKTEPDPVLSTPICQPADALTSAL